MGNICKCCVTYVASVVQINPHQQKGNLQQFSYYIGIKKKEKLPNLFLRDTRGELIIIG